MGFLAHRARDVVAIVVLLGLISGGMSHFATAADVEKKFSALQTEIKIVALEARKQRVEDELFKLRSDPKKPGTMPQVQRYESELRDVSQRLRDLEGRK